MCIILNTYSCILRTSTVQYCRSTWHNNSNSSIRQTTIEFLNTQDLLVHVTPTCGECGPLTAKCHPSVITSWPPWIRTHQLVNSCEPASTVRRTVTLCAAGVAAWASISWTLAMVRCASDCATARAIRSCCSWWTGGSSILPWTSASWHQTPDRSPRVTCVVRSDPNESKFL